MRELLKNNNGSISDGASMIGVVVATLVAIVVGVLIWYKINAGVFAGIASSVAYVPGVATLSRNATKAAWASVNTSANTIWTLFPIICIVLIAGIILAIVMGFGRQQA